MIRDNGWVLRKIQTLPADFFGEITLHVRGGAVRQLAETRTTVAPDILAEKDAAALRKATADVKPLRAHDHNERLYP